MKKITLLLGALLMTCASLFAQAPANAPDVMLQGFYWDSFGNGSYGKTTWATLQSQVEELSESFDLVWLPPSGKASNNPSTGYDPKKWSDQNSSWGTVTELKALIAAFKANGTRCVADIVINHRNGNYHWGDFENETFGSQTYTLYPSGQFICSDDEVRHQPNEVVPTGAKDAGYETVCDASGGYCASRDLDHSNAYLQKTIKAYLCWLKDEIGYDGWRYDLVKGYLGKYTKIYNEAAGAYYSVGEYWDRNYGGVKNWIEDTGKTSTAFDFPNKYATFNDALAGNNFGAMINGYKVPNGLCGADEMQQAHRGVDRRLACSAPADES
jgi:alpha-amylase